MEANFEDLVLLEWCYTLVAGRAIFRKVMIRSEPSSLMANYINIKQVESTQSCIAMAREENWVPEEWENTEESEERQEEDLIKIIYSRARQPKITISFYSLARGSRYIYYLEKNSRNRTRRVGSSYLVFGKGAVSSF